MTIARHWPVTFVLVLLVAAAPAAKKHHIFEVEYFQNQPDIAFLQVTFYKQLPAEKVAKILQRQLEVTVESYEPTVGVMATSYNAEGDGIGEPLVYLHKEKKIVTYAEYEASRKKK